MPINNAMLLQAIAELQQQGQGQFAGAMPPAQPVEEPVYGASKPTAQPEPNAQFAGIPTSAYYNAMAAKSQDPFFGGGHFAALRRDSEAGQDAYAEQLARAQGLTAKANEEGGRTEVATKLIDKTPDLAKTGSFGVIEPVLGDMTDDSEVIRHAVNAQNTTDAENRKTSAAANKDLFDAGVVQDTGDLEQQMTGPFADELVKLKSRLDAAGFTPAEVIDMLEAKAAMLSAQARMKSADASMINANRPRGSGKSKDDDDDDSSPTGRIIKNIFGK